VSTKPKNKIRRIGILTGGGDCPGLNAVIRAIAKSAFQKCGAHVYGISDGFHGLIHRNSVELENEDVSGILTLGGTILGSSNKDNPFSYQMIVDGEKKKVDVSGECIKYIKDMGFDVIFCLGGDGTLTIANRFFEMGVNMIGVPKTIDNDLMATDKTFGFQTAVDTATEAIDKLHTTAMSHHRVQVIEMMGRHAGWITLHAGIAGGADVILIPEIDFDIDIVTDHCLYRSRHGKRFTIIACSEGAKEKGGELTIQAKTNNSHDPVRLGGVADIVADKISDRSGLETRATVLGHLQRGGSPCSSDRLLATRFGHAAIEMAFAGKFGYMPALQGNKIVSVKLSEATSKLKKVSPDHPYIKAARALGTCFGDEHVE